MRREVTLIPKYDLKEMSKAPAGTTDTHSEGQTN